MEILEINNQIAKYSGEIEQLFLQLGDLFPSLLNRNGSTSLQSLQTMMRSLSELNASSSDNEKSVFTGFEEKYNPLFNQLNTKIEDLSTLNSMIAGIKEDSEQMELIALNAMVISIKSGEKGRAFSCITENLKRLSNDMFLFSDKLIEEEHTLLNNINSLKSIFSGTIESQHKLSTQSSKGESDVYSLISKVEQPLESMQKTIDEVYKPIRNAMESMQMQDIIRQALDHVEMCLKQIENDPLETNSIEDSLDSVCFSISLIELSEDVLTNISSDINNSCSEFSKNWQTVSGQLSKVETEKISFEQRFLDDHTPTPETLSVCLNELIASFKTVLDEFGHYHIIQKDLLRTCQNITEKARTMYTVFENIRPVMSRLHHVRILQQIEVSKNEAISSVKDSVIDMDKLICSANEALDNMQKLLESFITETGKLLASFTDSIGNDNEQMNKIRNEKNIFFGKLNSGKDDLSFIINNFTVFPTGFEKQCSTVQDDISKLQKISDKFLDFKKMLQEAKEKLNSQKTRLLSQKDISTWEIRNTKFRDLIEHFTITAHKEAAGKIGGFAIEKGIQSGNITFF